MFFPPKSMSFSLPPLVPSQAITVQLQLAIFMVPGCTYLPAAVGRAVTQTHTHFLTPACSIPAPSGWDKIQELDFPAHPLPDPPTPLSILPQEWPQPADQPHNLPFDAWSS